MRGQIRGGERGVVTETNAAPATWCQTYTNTNTNTSSNVCVNTNTNGGVKSIQFSILAQLLAKMKSEGF